MSQDTERFEDRIEALEREVAALNSGGVRRGIRKRSERSIGGFPWYDIAVGPDPDHHEVRGHARGVVVIGDIATGVFAIGGFARGIVAFGGLAIGCIALGGGGIGILMGIGGLATGLFAAGGCAIGAVAVGGGALGYYASGGLALGRYVISGLQQDPEALRFFGHWLPGLDQLLRPPGR